MPTDQNKIIRIKETHNTSDPIDRQYTEIYLTTFKQFIQKTKYIGYGGNIFEKLPYKWYEIQKLWTVLSYWLLLKFFRNNEHKIKIQTHKVTSIIVFITELLTFIKLIAKSIGLFS